MEITQRTIRGVTVLQPHGCGGTGAEPTGLRALRFAVTALIAQGRVNIVLDLAGLTSMDAEGLGELAFALQRLTRHGGRLVLACPGERVRRLLCITRLDTVFALADSTDAAIAQFDRTSPQQAIVAPCSASALATPATASPGSR